MRLTCEPEIRQKKKSCGQFDHEAKPVSGEIAWHPNVRPAGFQLTPLLIILNENAAKFKMQAEK